MAPDPSDPSSLLDPNYKVFGADTSFWSLELDFDKYKAAGASFVIIKALHGKNVDPYFIRNYSRARSAGVYVSSYQWLVPGSQLSIKDQVQAYAAILQDYPHDFVPWLDYEAGTRLARRVGFQRLRRSVSPVDRPRTRSVFGATAS